MVYRGVVFGWYHQRNAGDDRIAHCIEHWLDGHELTFLPHTSSPPIEVLQRNDYVILGGGSIANQVNGVFHDMRKWMSAANLPVFGVSITVSQYEEFKRELSAIPENGGTIWVRDEKSLEWLNFEKGLMFGPDISWLFPRQMVGQTRSEQVGVNFRPWSKIQWQPERWQQQLSNSLGSDRLHPWPLCFGKDPDLSVLQDIVDIDNAPTEFDPTVPSRSQLIVAMRYHAIIFAIQAGTPFIAVDNTRKVRDLLEQVGLPQLAVPLSDPSSFDEKLAYVQNNVSAETLLQTTQSMSEQTWKVADKMREAIESAADAHRSNRYSFSNKLSRKYHGLKTLIG